MDFLNNNKKSVLTNYMKLIYIFLILLISCGNPKKESIQNNNIFISYEKNEFICNSCILLNIEPNLLQIIFDQKTDLHECEGTYNYRVIDNEPLSTPSSLNEILDFRLEYIDSKDLSDCLTTILDFSIKNLGNDKFEVYINNDKYRLKK